MKLQYHHVKFSPFLLKIKPMDKNFLKYLSTAPVLITAWMSFTAGFIIELQRYMPDTLSLAPY